jgi:hypothetical protein
LFQNGLNLVREARDIFIYGLGSCLLSFHQFSFRHSCDATVTIPLNIILIPRWR